MQSNLVKTNYFNQERIQRILPSLLVSIALPLMVLIVAPIEIYCNNIAEFNFAIGDFLPILLLFSLGFVVLCFSVLFFSPKPVYKLAYALAVAGLVMLFIQTNFLNFGLNSLDGDNMSGSVSTTAIVINSIAWGLVLVGACAVFLILHKPSHQAVLQLICIVLSVALLLSQVVTCAVALISTDLSSNDSMSKRMATDEEYSPTFLTTKNLNVLSTDSNVVVFCVDRLDANLYVTQSMENNSEIYSSLSGFTYYGDNISMYGRTYPSVVYMITGMEWEHTERTDYFEKAYKENKTISTLNDLGYSINLYVDSFYSYADAYDLPDYIDNRVTVDKNGVEKRITDKLVLSMRMAQISGYRSFAFLLKGIGKGISSVTCNGLVEYDFKGLDESKYSTDMKGIYDKITVSDFVSTDEKMFSFIHLSGCHSIDYDTEWNETDSEDINLSLINSFAIINRYIDQMKRLGVYDNSTIIITGDHSHPYNDFDLIREPRLTALFVKPPKRLGINLDDSGNFNKNYTVSNSPVSHENLWATIFQAENIITNDDFGKSVFDIDKDDSASATSKRKFLWQVDTRIHNRYTDYVYTITGSGKDIKNWTPSIGKLVESSLMN